MAMTSTLPHSTTSEAPPERAAAIRRCLESLELPDRRLSADEAETAALAVAEHRELWSDLVVDSPDTRWWIVLYRTASYEVRLLSWEFDQSSGWHDHGGSCGGFVITEGVLCEHYRGEDAVSSLERRFHPGEHGNFGPSHVHDVGHGEGRPAVSIHAYSPPLTSLSMYDVTPYGFVVREVVPDDRRGL
jgi:hypothetical protein